MPIAITIGGYQKPDSIHNRAARHFGEALERRLGDRISFHHTGNVLDLGHASGDLPDMVENGELSCCYMSTVRFTQAVPELRMFELPFLVRDHAAAHRALDGELGALLRRRMSENSEFRVLGFWNNGFRHISNRIRPIRKPGDCSGLRIRTQLSELHGEVFRALGFVPVPADIKQFLEEIETERFDAQDNPLTNIFNFGVHRHHRHITLTGHLFGVSLMICNDRHYRSWPREVRDAVDAAAVEATALQWRLAADEDAKILGKFDLRTNDVIHLTAPEHAAFVDAVRPVLARYRRELDAKLLAYLE